MIIIDGLRGADFDESISKTEREMKGFVEVTYTNSKAKENATVSSDLSLLMINNEISSPNEVYDNNKIGTNYATLEKDYFKLDGTFILPNNKLSENPGLGLVTQETFKDDVNSGFAPIKISTNWGNTAPADGLTLYFKNNIPTDLEIFVNSGDGSGPTGQQTFYTKDMTISETGIVNLTFSPRKINFARIYIKGVRHPEWRIRIEEIDFGVSYLYENEELISFNTIETIDRFNDSMPINECEVVLGNLDRKFNYDNPYGITKYLNDGVEIKPFVGVRTLESGIVYCPKGVFWLKEWNANKREATLKGQDILCKLQTKDFDIAGFNNQEIDKYLAYKSNAWKIPIVNKHDDPSLGISEWVLDYGAKITTKAISLQKMGIFCGGTFNADRFGAIKYFDDNYPTFGTGTGKEIDFNIMRDFPRIVATNPISNITVNGYLIDYDIAGLNKQTLYEERFDLNGIIDLYIDLKDFVQIEQPILNNCTIKEDNFEGGPRTQNSYVYIKLQCNGKSSIKLEGYKLNKSKYENKKVLNETGTEITIDDDFVSTNMSTAPDYLKILTGKILDYSLANRPKYKIDFAFNGDPRLEAGDFIKVKNRYSDNFNTVVITKINSTFKGSYKEEIEGDIYEEKN